MKKIIAAVILLISVLSIYNLVIYASDEKQISINRTTPIELDEFYENAYDWFEIDYSPIDKSLQSSQVCTVYTFLIKDWGSIQNNSVFKEQYTIYDKTDKFVFVIRKNNANPYPNGTKDNDNFRNYSSHIEKFISDMGVGEIKIRNTKILGLGMEYLFSLPSMQDVIATRKIPSDIDSFSNGIDFLYTGKSFDKIAEMRVFEKLKWDKLEKDVRLDFGKPVLDFMGYVFVISDYENPFPTSTIYGEEFQDGYNKISGAVSRAFVYNEGGINNKISLGKDVNTAKLNVGGNIVGDKILFDSNNSPLFPLKALATSLGCKVLWDAKTSKFTIIKGNDLIAVKSIEHSYTLENYKTAEDHAYAIINGSTYVDLNFVIKTLNCGINFNGVDTFSAIMRSR